MSAMTDLADPVALEAAAPVVAHALAGRNRRLVVSLSGVGRSDAEPSPEFVAEASAGGENHVLFLGDASRSWMNGPGVADEMVRLIEAYREAHGIEEVVTLGHSMGGFAALILPQLTEVKTAIAFAPQFSMKPALVPEERRWRDHADAIKDWRFPDVGTLDCAGVTYFLFHGDNPVEAQHWLRFPIRRKVVNHFIFVGQAHNIATVLQKRQMLHKAVALAVAQKPRALRLALEKSFLNRRFIVRRREQYQTEHPELTLAPGGAPMVMPPAEEERA